MDEDKQNRTGEENTDVNIDSDDVDTGSPSPADAWRARREEEKKNRNPSLYQELFAPRDEDGNKRPPMADRFEDYTKKQVRRQQNIDRNMAETPVSGHTFLIGLGIVVILFLFVIVMTQCNGM